MRASLGWDTWEKLVARRPALSLVFFLMLTGIMYFLANRVPIFEARVIEPTWLDRQIPLVPWTIPLYYSYFLLLPVFCFLNAQDARWPDFFLRILLCVLTVLTINFLVPTRIHRLIPIPLVDNSLVHFMTTLDTELCAIPSGHVALPVCLFLLSWRHRLARPWLFLVWSAALVLLTLTTKQHFLPDVLTGLAVGTAFGFAKMPFERTAL